MSDSEHPRIAWAPRSVLAGRTFRLPVAGDAHAGLQAPDFREVAARRAVAWLTTETPGRWRSETASFHYLKAPDRPGIYPIRLVRGGIGSERSIQVLGMEDLLGSSTVNGVVLPRRWRPGTSWESTKTARTLEDEEIPSRANAAALRFWLTASDSALWHQLPPAELPKAHFVNEHHGCPACGTRVFRHGGFYPWKRDHLPCTFHSTCPSCHAVFPSNNLHDGDFTSGDSPDDGYGLFDSEGRLFLFAATYHRDQLRAFSGGITLLAGELRRQWSDETARRLGLLLARYALEELYVAASPQFRYGPSKGLEEPWQWGQEDWLGAALPLSSLAAKGTLHYSIDTPWYASDLARAYDAVWPFIRGDEELAERVRAQGLPVSSPAELSSMVEQMLACLLQCILDLGARSNLPQESLAALVLLAALDRSDAQDVMEWLYRSGPDRLGVFCVNDFLPDGSPPEATGGYNSIHTDGLFALERELRRLKARHPRAYPEAAFPSVLHPSRAARCILQPHELTMVGKSWFQFGDGSAPGTPAVFSEPEQRRSILLERPVFSEPLHEHTYELARKYIWDGRAREAVESVLERKHRAIGSTIHDRVGIAIMRTGGAPERAALGIAYGDTSGHRHLDLGDVQLLAFERPFLTDLGYPQSWATISRWEGHWATHNAAWGVSAEPTDARVAGRGRIVSFLRGDGIQILDVEMERFARSSTGWRRIGVQLRRLVALVETDAGVAVIDLSRVRGGTEHWRICRGLEGELRGFSAHGPPAGTESEGRSRTILELLRAGGTGYDGPEYEAFAFMDDAVSAPAPLLGPLEWRSLAEPEVALDLHLIGASPGTEVYSARATQTMGRPEESLYTYRTLAWRRAPLGPADVSAVDLLFEPRIGEATVRSARAIPVAGGAPDSGSTGLEIVTRLGRSVLLYWSPWAEPGSVTSFADGRRLEGTLLAVTDGAALRPARALRARIESLERGANTVDVRAEAPIRPGGRARPDRPGCFTSYEVVAVEKRGQLQRLTLDVSSLLGVSRVASVGDGSVELADPLLTRSAYLCGARVVASSAGPGDQREVEDAANIEGQRTRLRLRGAPGLREGEHVELVDYVAGDTLLVEAGPRALDGGTTRP